MVLSLLGFFLYIAVAFAGALLLLSSMLADPHAFVERVKQIPVHSPAPRDQRPTRRLLRASHSWEQRNHLAEKTQLGRHGAVAAPLSTAAAGELKKDPVSGPSSFSFGARG